MLKNFYLPITLLSLFVITGCQNNDGHIEKKPNIVFILVDDLGYMDLGFTGSTYYETPHIDQLAGEAMVFNQGYAASRVCSPSRASIMTGKFTARHGITDWIGAKSGVAWRETKRNDKLLPAHYVHNLPKQEITLAESLGEAGYKTFFAGKWHLGAEGSYPEDHGFDYNAGGWDKGSPIGGYFSPWENPKLPNKENGENLSMRLAKETVRFIEQHKDSTFFAFLSFYAVHGPIQTTQEKWKKYRDKVYQNPIPENGYTMERVLPIRQVQDNPIYAGLVAQMDDAVGLVLKSLQENGLDKNTIVVFTSDNGGVASGDSFSTSNLPLRGGKGYQWEGGIREPFVIKVPMFDQGVGESDYPVIGTDFYPTLLDLANVELKPDQHMDGLSLRPILEGKQLTISRPLYWHYPHYGNQGGNPSSIIQENGWKLIYYWETGQVELYDLMNDISERQELSTQRPDMAKAMSKKLGDWLAQVEAKLPELDTAYDVRLAKERYSQMLNIKLPALEKERKEVLSIDFSPNEDWWGSKRTKD